MTIAPFKPASTHSPMIPGTVGAGVSYFHRQSRLDTSGQDLTRFNKSVSKNPPLSALIWHLRARSLHAFGKNW